MNGNSHWTYHQILNKKPSKVYLSLGSNLGDRQFYLSQALSLLRQERSHQIVQTSSIYETEPVGCREGGLFLNQVVYLVTLFSAEELLAQLQSIESSLGRQRKEKNEPRVIDIDILFYGNDVLAHPHLQIPHPRLHERRFVLEPLNELNPQIWHPVFNKSVQELLSDLKSNQAVCPVSFA